MAKKKKHYTQEFKEGTVGTMQWQRVFWQLEGRTGFLLELQNQRGGQAGHR